MLAKGFDQRAIAHSPNFQLRIVAGNRQVRVVRAEGYVVDRNKAAAEPGEQSLSLHVPIPTVPSRLAVATRVP